MIWGNEGYIIKQFFYSRKEYMDSTHRPVTAYYALEVKSINKEKREEIIKQIYEVFLLIYLILLKNSLKNQKNEDEDEEGDVIEEETKAFNPK